MADTLDPYHRWLGIPAEEQPPNHYRLLGLALFEADPEVVRDAAERQIAHVRRYELGKHAALSQKMLNELAAAKACLLDPAAKAPYDCLLRQRLSQQSPQTVVPPVLPTPPNPPTPPALPLPTPVVVPPLPSAFFEPDELPAAMTRNRESILTRWPLTVIAAAFGLLAVIVLVYWSATAKRPANDPPPPVTVRPVVETPPPTTEEAVRKEAAPPTREKPRPPQLQLPATKYVTQGESLVFPIQLDDRGSPDGPLVFRLAPGAPEGATIDSSTGQFDWIVPEAHLPGPCSITVEVARADAPEVRAAMTFMVIVRKRPLAPALEPIGSRALAAGSSLEIPLSTLNPDGVSRLTFELVEGPAWVEIEPAGRCLCRPPLTTPTGRHEVTVRVVTDDPTPRTDEKSFVIMVYPGVRPVAPQVPRLQEFADLGNAYFELPLLTGKLSSSDFEIRTKVINDSATLLDWWMKGRTDAVAVFVPPRGSGQYLSALCSYVQGKLDGVTVVFHERQDPMTCYLQQGDASVSVVRPGMTSSRLRPGDAAVGFWNYVMPKRYATYQKGRWHGVLATWDAEGQKDFWCGYVKGERHGFCCLFKEDRLRMVLECSNGTVNTVHLVSANQLERSLQDVATALADPTAARLLGEIDAIEERLQREEKDLSKGVDLSLQQRAGKENVRRRAEFQERVNRNAESWGRSIDTLRRMSGH